MDDSLQPTIDMLLNLAVFMWFGAVCPWSTFLNNDIIPIYRLIFLGILILLVRRMPIIFAMHKYIHQIEHLAQAAFVGFFGPIGVGAIFYLSISREFLKEITVDGKVREDAQQVMDAVWIVVWFLVICSIVSTPPPHIRLATSTNKPPRSSTASPSQSAKPATTSHAQSPTSSARAPWTNPTPCPSQPSATRTAQQHPTPTLQVQAIAPANAVASANRLVHRYSVSVAR